MRSRSRGRGTAKIQWAPSLMAVIIGCSSALPVLAQGPIPPAPAAGKGSAPPASTSANGQPITLQAPDQFGPDSDAKHDQNKTLRMDQLRLHSAVSINSFKTVRDEVGYDEPISLASALKYAVENNLAIKVSKESYNYQRFGLMGSLASTLPSFALSYNLTRTDIQNEHQYSLARSQLEKITYPVFQGGSVMYGLLAQAYRTRGWFHAFRASINDTLLQVYQNYNNVLLARVLLQIRAKACEVDEEQLRVNQQLEVNGAGTRFAVLQSDAQLATDRQALIQQQVAVRQAALGLNYSLNSPMAINLVPMEETLTEESIFLTNSRINDIVTIAIKNRPELKQYEMYKFGAERNIQVAAAPLYPQVSFFTAVSYTNTTQTTNNLFSAAATAEKAALTAALTSPSSGSSGSSSSGSSSKSISVTTSSGTTVSASSSKSSSGSTSSSSGSGSSGSGSTTSSSSGSGSSSSSSSSSSSASDTSGAGVFGGVFRTIENGLGLTWNLNGLGLVNVANLFGAQSTNREAGLQLNQELQTVLLQVRSDYLTWRAAREQIDNAAHGVDSSNEALRLAEIRLREGVGTNLELITAESAYITALTTQAQAIVGSNMAQAQLLHDTGLISVDTLLHGYKGTTTR